MKFVELLTKLVDIEIYANIKLKEKCPHCEHEEELIEKLVTGKNKIVEDFQPYMQRKVISIETDTTDGFRDSCIVIVLSEEDAK